MRLPGFANIRPPKPTRTDEAVAFRIAERIVREVNLDDVYWAADKVPERVWQLQQVVMAGVNSHSLIRRCNARFIGSDWHWEGIDDHCCAIAKDIIGEEVRKAIAEWEQKYEVKPKPA